MPEDNTIVAIKKPLPKATPLMPGEEGQDEALVQAFNPLGLTPTIDMDDPDVRAALSAYDAAQAKLQQTIKRKAMLRLVQAGDSLDPERVEELCAAEPWKKGPVSQLNKGLMGFVPEKFEARALSFPEGSDEYRALMVARDKAAQIYWDQMKAELRKTCAKFDNDPTLKNKRLGYEPLSASLWSFAKTLEPMELWDQQRGRVMWMALNLGEEYMNKYGRDRASGPGYQQWSLRLENEEGPHSQPANDLEVTGP